MEREKDHAHRSGNPAGVGEDLHPCTLASGELGRESRETLDWVAGRGVLAPLLEDAVKPAEGERGARSAGAKRKGKEGREQRAHVFHAVWKMSRQRTILAIMSA